MSGLKTAFRRQHLPQIVRDVIHAVRTTRLEPGSRRSPEADALRAFAHLAHVTIAAKGVLAPGDSDLVDAIETVARRHLGTGKYDTRLQQALRRIEPFELRDPVETAQTETVLATATAYYYFGLAVGLVFAARHRTN